MLILCILIHQQQTNILEGYVLVTVVLQAWAEAFSGLYGYSSSPIAIMYLLTEIFINIAANQH